jgi:hypothetical protein
VIKDNLRNYEHSSIICIGTYRGLIDLIGDLQCYKKIIIISDEDEFAVMGDVPFANIKYIVFKSLWLLNNFEEIIKNFSSIAFDESTCVIFNVPSVTINDYWLIPSFLSHFCYFNTNIFINIELGPGIYKELTFSMSLSGKFVNLPSERLFMDMFSNFSFRKLSETQGSTSYLVNKRKSTVTLIGGATEIGKTFRSQMEQEAGAVLIRLDYFLGSIDDVLESSDSHQESHFLQICDEYKRLHSTENVKCKLLHIQDIFSKYLVSSGFDEAFFKCLTSRFSHSCTHFVVEGGLLCNDELKSRLHSFLAQRGFIVWDLTRM